MLSGTTNHGFAVLRTQPLPELGAVMHHLRHERTGLELVWLERDEVNRTFGIASRPCRRTTPASFTSWSTPCSAARSAIPSGSPSWSS